MKSKISPALMRGPILACVVRKLHKSPFRAIGIISVVTLRA